MSLCAELAAFAAGQLMPAEMEKFRAHLADCEPCFEQLSSRWAVEAAGTGGESWTGGTTKLQRGKGSASAGAPAHNRGHAGGGVVLALLAVAVIAALASLGCGGDGRLPPLYRYAIPCLGDHYLGKVGGGGSYPEVIVDDAECSPIPKRHPSWLCVRQGERAYGVTIRWVSDCRPGVHVLGEP